MLYRPEAFEPLTDDPWDADRVREAIREIVSDTDRAFDQDRLWPADEWDAWNTPVPLKCVYVGAAGVIWALDALRRRGHADSRIDLASAARRTLDGWRETPDFMRGLELPAHARASLLCGESGILAVAWRLEPSADLAEDLLARVRENVNSDVDELMWGTPGTMVAARAMLDWTGEERWADAWRESADALWARREPDGFWTQWLYGQASRGIGPVHGALGNVGALLQGGALLSRDRRQALEQETADLLARTAVVENGLANWPADDGLGLVAKDGQIRVQWCHGAPGVIVSAAPYLHEKLLLAGAELTWRAGPAGPDKGAGICHGTAGNGYAFLKTFERTGDELWLERARRFAVHARAQVDRARTARGHGRYSLWTGDLGVALYAADCLDGRGAYPIVDSWGD